MLNDCLWYDKLWGPSQRVVTLFLLVVAIVVVIVVVVVVIVVALLLRVKDRHSQAII